MKNTSFLTTLILFLFLGFSAHAQVPKLPTADLSKQVLGILDNVSGLNLNADQTTKLKADNKTFVDQLLKVSNGTGTDEEKKKSILGLKDKRTQFLTDLIGSDLFKKYSGNVLTAINPLKSKLGLAALAF